MTLLQEYVGRQGSVQELQQVVLLQRLQYIKLTTRQQRSDHLERGVLGGCSDEGHDAALHSPQQGVLLRLRETVNLVNK